MPFGRNILQKKSLLRVSGEERSTEIKLSPLQWLQVFGIGSAFLVLAGVAWYRGLPHLLYFNLFCFFHSILIYSCVFFSMTYGGKTPAWLKKKWLFSINPTFCFFYVFLIVLYVLSIFFHLDFFLKGDEPPLYILISGGASGLYFRYFAKTNLSRFFSLFSFLLSNLVDLVLIYQSSTTIIFSLLILLLGFVPCIPYEGLFTFVLISRIFLHSTMQNLGISLLLYICVIDFLIFVFKKKIKPFFFVHIGFLSSLLIITLKNNFLDCLFPNLLSMSGALAFYFLFIAVTPKEHFLTYLGYVTLNILAIYNILSNMKVTLLFLVINIIASLFFFFFRLLRPNQSLSEVLLELKKDFFPIFAIFLLFLTQFSRYRWVSDWVGGLCYQFTLISLIRVIVRPSKKPNNFFFHLYISREHIFLYVLLLSPVFLFLMSLPFFTLITEGSH